MRKSWIVRTSFVNTLVCVPSPAEGNQSDVFGVLHALGCRVPGFARPHHGAERVSQEYAQLGELMHQHRILRDLLSSVQRVERTFRDADIVPALVEVQEILNMLGCPSLMLQWYDMENISSFERLLSHCAEGILRASERKHKLEQIIAKNIEAVPETVAIVNSTGLIWQLSRFIGRSCENLAGMWQVDTRLVTMNKMRIVADMLEISVGASVFYMGVGCGGQLRAFQDAGATLLVGQDLLKANLDFIEESHPSFPLCGGDAGHFLANLPNKTFDYIVSNSLMEKLPLSKRCAFLSNSLRVARLGIYIGWNEFEASTWQSCGHREIVTYPERDLFGIVEYDLNTHSVFYLARAALEESASSTYKPATMVQTGDLPFVFFEKLRRHGDVPTMYLDVDSANDPPMYRSGKTAYDRNGLYYQPIRRDNTAVCIHASGSFVTQYVAQQIKALRNPEGGAWPGPIIILSDRASYLRGYIAHPATQEWMACRNFRTTAEAFAQGFPTFYYGGRGLNPCAISFMQYNAEWLTWQDYRRTKMGIGEILDVENFRRVNAQCDPSLSTNFTIEKLIARRHPLLEHAIYLDADCTIVRPFDKYIEFFNNRYTGESMSLFHQPMGLELDYSPGHYHGGTWHSPWLLGRELSRTWLRTLDVRNIFGMRESWRDQNALDDAVYILTDGGYFSPWDGLQLGNNSQEGVVATDIVVHAFGGAEDPYPLEPGKLEDETMVVIHWSGWDEDWKYFDMAYKKHIPRLGLPDFLKKIPGGLPADALVEQMGERFRFRELESLSLLTLRHVPWKLTDGQGKPTIVLLDLRDWVHSESERGIREFVLKEAEKIFSELKPIYLVVVLADMVKCRIVHDLTNELDGILAQQHGLEMLVSSRALLCMSADVGTTLPPPIPCFATKMYDWLAETSKSEAMTPSRAHT